MARVYDAGALIALERELRSRTRWLAHEAALLDGDVYVPAPVVAQVWRGGPQATVSRALAGCWVTPMDDGLAREAGILLALAGTSDVVDATVVALARRTASDIVTSDVDDIRRLVIASGAPLRVLAA
jgi:hypothetical protein